MAENQLRYKITADSSGFVNGVKQAATSTNNLNKGLNKSQRGLRRNSQAFTQLAYAMDDAQYGFRGVQNNLQQIAVTAGVGGPLIVGITALIITVGVLIDKWQKAKKEALEAAELTAKALAKSEGPIVKMQLYADTIKTAEKNTFEYKDALEKLKKLGFDPLNTSIDEFIKKKSAIIRLNAIEDATTKAVSDKIAEQIRLQNEIDTLVDKRGDVTFNADGTLAKTGFLSGVEADSIRDKIERIKKLDGQIESLITTGKTAAKDLIKENKLTPEDYDNFAGDPGEAGAKAGDLWAESFKEQVEAGLADPKDIKTFAEGLFGDTAGDYLNNPLDKIANAKGGKITKDVDFIDEFSAEEYINGFIDLDQAIRQSKGEIISFNTEVEEGFNLGETAITSFLSALNTASSGGFDNFAAGIIDTAKNIAFAMAIAAATKDSVKFGAVALPALIGVALGVVGSAFRSNVKGTSGGGRSTAATIAATSFSATPFMSQQNQGGSGQLVATVRGPDLIFALQNANATYGQTGG